MERVDYQSLVIQDVINLEKQGELNLNPWYQRRSVWKDSQKSYLINTLFERKPIPTIYIRHAIDMEKEKSIKEVGIGTAIGNTARALVFVLKCFIPIIRTIVYYVYSTRQNIYDYFTVQAQMLEMNAYKLQQNNNIDEDVKKKAYEKQMKIATKFRNIANKFAIEDSVV